MGDRSDPQIPMRIEMATSEIDGSRTLAWADPEQVIACVAQSQPRDAFERFVAPRLADLSRDRKTPAEQERTVGGGPPERVSILISRLQQAHSRLYRENQTGDVRRIVRPAIALVEESTIYFVKGCPCWIFLLREGTASPLWMGGETTSDALLAPALGESDRLRLAVSSIEVEPLDVLVLLACDSTEPPDRHAVSQVFDQVQDLKRACDGLVNLFTDAPSGAAAIAMRFVPIGAGSETGGRSSAFDDFVEDLRDIGGGDSSGTSLQLPQWLRDVGQPEPRPQVIESSPMQPMRAGPRPIEPAPLDPDTVDPKAVDLGPGEMAPSAGEPVDSRPTDRKPATPEEKRRPAPRGETRVRRTWVIATAGVLVMVATLVGVPRGMRALRAGSGSQAGGSIRIDPSPRATAIYVDGVDQGTGSPAVLEGIIPGPHTVKLDLGPFGSVEEKVRVLGGQTTNLTAAATGAVEVSVVDPRPGATAWVAGGKHLSIPCRLDTLAVGWREIFYEDDQLPLWERQVPVRAGETMRICINNAFSRDRGLLRVESWSYRPGDGLRSMSDDSVYVDGRLAGLTPLEKEVRPGLHGVRVSGSAGRLWTEVVDLAPGSSRVVAPHFGMGDWARFTHKEPGRVVLRGPLLLTVRIDSPEGSAPRNPRLHLPGLNASLSDVPLSPVDPSVGTYVGIVDARWIPVEMPVAYYFTVQTDSGEILSSDLFHLTIVREDS